MKGGRLVAILVAGFFALSAMVLFARSIVFDWYRVPTGAMKPTIPAGGHVLVWKCAYQIRIPFSKVRLFETGAPRRGDVIVIRNPDGGSVPFVKRLVGLPGDVIELRNETLYIGGKAQPIEFLPEQKTEDGEAVLFGAEMLDGRPHPVRILPERAAFRTFGPITVPPGEVFLLGDNRDESRDSRFFGTRPAADLLGRVAGLPTGVRGPRP